MVRSGSWACNPDMLPGYFACLASVHSCGSIPGLMIHPQLPNAITIMRLILVPVLIFLLNKGEFGWALAVFVVAGVSDGLDGYLARKYGLQSEFGGFLDPVADKVLMIATYVSLVLLGLLPVWLVLLVAARDFLIIGFIMMLVSLGDQVRPTPSIYSKINTGVQTLLVMFVLIQKTFAPSLGLLVEILIYTLLVTTLVSTVNYYWVWVVQRMGRREDGH
jgi:cardiolipin synthase